MPLKLRDNRDRLRLVLARRAPVDAASLAAELDVSVPTMHRMLSELGADLVAAGRARRARYALRRPVRGDPAAVPVFEIDEAGRARALADVVPVHPMGVWCALARSDWPVPAEARDGWWDGLPYPLQDMRPQGYLGRQLALREHRAHAVSPHPSEWSDDDVLYVLARVGSDVSGNLILGEPALDRWRSACETEPAPLSSRALPSAYPRLAEQAIAAGVPGSSAAGEFPKFPARRERAGARTPHVLVKFSGADDSPAVRRWSDLLVCEHLALETLGAVQGISAAQSRVIQAAGRTFLEVERFDRHGLHGRSRLVSLEAVNAAFLGESTSDWTTLVARLASLGLASPETVTAVEVVWWFGRLIANTDMHLGNLSFGLSQGFEIAPVYDMVPMAYAPLPGGEVAARAFQPSLPPPAQRAAWLTAAHAAHGFWVRACADTRIGEGFRDVCRENAEALVRVAERV